MKNQIERTLNPIFYTKASYFLGFTNACRILSQHFRVSVVLLLLTINAIAYAQTNNVYTTSLHYKLNIKDALRLIKNNSSTKGTEVLAIKANNNSFNIKVSVFETAKFNSLPESQKSKSFLIGTLFSAGATDNNLQNNAFQVETVENNMAKWGPFVYDMSSDNNEFTKLHFSNDYREFKKKIRHIAKLQPSDGYTNEQVTLNVFGKRIATIYVTIKIEIQSTSIATPTLETIEYIDIPGIKRIYPNVNQTVNVAVYRGSNTIPVNQKNYSPNDPIINELVVYEGDSVVFTASKPLKMEGLTDISIMRWAGESLYLSHNVTMPELNDNLSVVNQQHKPFLFFDSNVHGIKLRRYPPEWANGNHNYPRWVQNSSGVTPSYKYVWIANSRRDMLIDAENDAIYNVPLASNKFSDEFYTKPEEVGKKFPNVNKYSGFSEDLDYQRNNQKEGLNWEIIMAYKNKEKGVAGLDPDELIYKDFAQSEILNVPESASKIFNYVNGDEWKKITKPYQIYHINNTLKMALTEIGKFLGNGEEYVYKGNEILDKNLFIYKNESEKIDDVFFDNTVKQDMFNKKRPVYYNPNVENKPLYHKQNKLDVTFSDQSTLDKPIPLTVLSPLEGKRHNVAYDALAETQRANPKVNFYGIIEGPTFVSRYQENVLYKVNNLPNFNDVPGFFRLVYTSEDSYACTTQSSKIVSGNDPNFVLPKFQGGGYHEMTLYYYRTKDTISAGPIAPVIIAGKELIDIDLRFIFSPGVDNAKNYSNNPVGVFGQQAQSLYDINTTALLDEKQGSGNRWFLSDQNASLVENNYGLNHGYDDHNVVRTYSLVSNQELVLTVLDADPHNFVHYQEDFYLSERRLSKRISDNDLADSNGKSKITWYKSSVPNPTPSQKTLLGHGKHFRIKSDIFPNIQPGVPQALYISAEFNETSKIKVKVIYQSFISFYNIIGDDVQKSNIGNVKYYPMSDTQFLVFNELLENRVKEQSPADKLKTKDDYFILRVGDLLSSYVYGKFNPNKENHEEEIIAPRYKEIDQGGKALEVGEHKRFSIQNNFDARFHWSFKKSNNQPVLLTDISHDFSDMTDPFLESWFPKNWIRHLDNEPQSPEIPIFSTEARPTNFIPFNTKVNPNVASYNNYAGALYEPWQVRLPWIAQSGLHGYKTRWNIKTIFDIEKIFNRDEIGNAYNVATNVFEYNQNVIGPGGLKIVEQFDDEAKELQEFFWHLKTNRMVVIDKERFYQLFPNQQSINVTVLNKPQNSAEHGNFIYSGNVSTPALTIASRAVAQNVKPTETLLEDAITVYPNQSKDGIFNVNITSNEVKVLSLFLYDASGKLIYQSQPTTISGIFETKIGEDLHLKSGMYLLKIKINNEEATKKLIVE